MDFGMNEMLTLQKELQEKYKKSWDKNSPDIAASKFLWMIGELSEAADIIKKQGSYSIINNEEQRCGFIEELSDAIMYFCDILLCFDISIEEFKEIYLKKMDYNLSRWS